MQSRGGLAGRAIRADARREKVRENMETFAFLSISAHRFTFSTIRGPVWSNCARTEKYSQFAPGSVYVLRSPDLLTLAQRHLKHFVLILSLEILFFYVRNLNGLYHLYLCNHLFGITP